MELVKEHFNVLDNKVTDALTVREKQAEWSKVAVKCNQLGLAHNRNGENLKMIQNIKRAAEAIQKVAKADLYDTGEFLTRPNLILIQGVSDIV